MLSEISMHPTRLTFETVPFIRFDLSVDVFAIIDLDPMPVLLLGISRPFKDFLRSYLGTEVKNTSSLSLSCGRFKIFKQTRKAALQSPNEFFLFTATSPLGMEMNNYFFRNLNGSRLSVLFTESGLTGMLRAKDLENIKKITPFLGAFVESYCGQ